MKITLKDYQKRLALNPPQIIKVTKQVLKFVGIHQATLSLVFVSRQKITALNKKFLNRSHGTDVLAFDSGERSAKNRKRKIKGISGDIIISTDAVWKNSKVYELTISQELTLYLIHGILHLTGYNDHKTSDVKKMRKKEKEILTHLGSSVKLCLR